MTTILAASLISTDLLTKLAIFGAVACGVWWLLELLATGKPRAERRLEEFREPNTRRSDARTAKRSNGMTRLLQKASPTFSKPLQPKTEEEVGKLRLKLGYAGFRSETAASIFLGLKLIGLVVGFIIGGGLLLWRKGWTMETGMYTVGSAGLAFYLPDVVLWFLKKTRQDNIFFGLPDALDLMVVCVEAGLGLDQAMRKVSEEMKKTYVVIAEEFGLCNLQLQMGRSRNEVLHDLGARTGVDDLKALAGHPDPGRQIRLERGPGAARAERFDADPPSPAGRRKGRQDGGQADLPAGDLHLPGDLHRAGGPRRDHDGQRDVPGDAGPQITSRRWFRRRPQSHRTTYPAGTPTNGFVRFSWPIVVAGPWPRAWIGTNRQSFPGSRA